MSNLTISVVVPTCNRRQSLVVAMNSVLQQSRVVDELIVVDDGSSDDSAAVVKAMGAVTVRPQIVLIKQSNRGPAAARNAGLRVAKSDLIAFLDDDDLWYPEKTALQHDVFAADPDLALLGCASDSFRPAVSAALTRVGIAKLLIRNWFMTSCTMIRRDAALDCGGFPEGMRVCEDYAFWLRVAGHNKCAYFDRVLVGYAGGKPGFGHSGLSADVDALFAGEREALRLWCRDSGAGRGTAILAHALAFARHARRRLLGVFARPGN